jgi:carboxyl-terminal processing protease
MTVRKRLALVAAAVAMLSCGIPGGVHARFGYSEHGLRVVDVDPDGPAARAGLRENDRVLAIDEEDVDAMDGEAIVEKLRGDVGAPVRLSIARESEIVEITILRAPYRLH